MSFFGSGSGSSTGFTFGGDQSQQQQVRFVTPATTQGFTFGTPTQNTGTTGTMLGATPTQPANTGFTFGAATNPSGGGGFSFGTPARSSTPSGFSFGTPSSGTVPNPTTTSAVGIRFANVPNVTATPGGGFFGATTGSATPNAGFPFGTPSVAGAIRSAAATTTPSPFGSGFTTRPATAVTTATGMAGSTFGTTGGMSFGQTPATTTAMATSTFGFPGNAAPSVPSFGMSNPTVPSAPMTSGISFGSGTALGTSTTPFAFNPLATTLQNKGFSFGGTATNTTSSIAPIASTATAATTSTPAAVFQFGSSVTTTASAPTPNLQATGVGAPALPTFGLSKIPGTSPLAGGTLGSTLATSTSGGLTFGASKPNTSLTLSSTTAPVASLSTGLGSIAATSAVPGTVAATAATTSAPTGYAFGLAPKPLVSTSLLASGTTQPSTTSQAVLTLTTSVVTTSQTPLTSATTSSVASGTVVPPAATINFRKLEDDINKWTLELEEQERFFLTQATQVNAWDRILISNGEKITQLNDALERVKLDQEHLDQEIDFIRSQQSELEELLVPLEKSVEALPTLSIHQHADLEREQTFQMAENIDGQLRLMSRDLKEIIEHLNSTAGTQDSSNPIQQIGKILNSHMDSLQWIDQNTNVLSKKVDEVSRLYEVCRQDQEKGLQLPYM